MAHHLGLGGYGSDDDDEGSEESGAPAPANQGLTIEPPRLLHSYPSAEDGSLAPQDSLTLAGRGFNAAPDVQEPIELPPQPAVSDQPQTSGGNDQDLGMPTRPPSRVAPTDPVSIMRMYLSELPPEMREPPPGECQPGVVAYIERLHQAQASTGKSFVDSLRGHQTYSNPDFLQGLVQSYHLQEHGSAFPKDVFDPNGLPAEDYFDHMMTALEREQERRKAARSTATPGTTSIAFERGTGPMGTLPASQSAGNLQQQAALLAAGRAAAAAAAAQLQAKAMAMGGKKKSKWDG